MRKGNPLGDRTAACMELEILYRDDRMVVVHKPSGLLVHPSTEAPDRVTCMSLLRDQLGQHVHPIHRLDRGTSGVLLFCLDHEAARAAGLAFQERRVEKTYLTVVRGWTAERGENAGEMSGREAFTAFERLATTELPIPVGPHPTARYSLLRVFPRTGLRHQIRRHLRRLSHPVVGDVKHGDGAHNRLFREHFGCDRLVLLAESLTMEHPTQGGRLVVETRPDPELEELFSRLGLHRSPRL